MVRGRAKKQASMLAFIDPETLIPTRWLEISFLTATSGERRALASVFRPAGTAPSRWLSISMARQADAGSGPSSTSAGGGS